MLGRYYDPATEQFLNVDPLVDETGTPYAFTGGDPVNGSDPSGMDLLGGIVDSFNPFSQNNVFYRFGSHHSVAGRALAYGTGSAAALVAGAACLTGGCEAAAIAGGSAWTSVCNWASSLFNDPAVDTLPEDSVTSDAITGFTTHGADQFLGRDGGLGVNAPALNDAVDNPIDVIPQAGGTVKYIGQNATVVLNQAGKVVTTWARGTAGLRNPPA